MLLRWLNFAPIGIDLNNLHIKQCVRIDCEIEFACANRDTFTDLHNEWLELIFSLLYFITAHWSRIRRTILTHSIFLVADFTRDDVTELKGVQNAISTTFRAKTIFLGTYRFDSQKDLVFTSRGIRMVVPNMKRPGEMVVLNIHRHEIVRMVYHFAAELSVMFMYVVSSCSKYVREEIEMGAECRGESINSHN